MTELFMEIIGKEKHTKAGRQGCIIIVPSGHTFCLGDIAIKDRVSPIFIYFDAISAYRYNRDGD